MNSARIQKAIEHRKTTDNEWDDELERCWAELTEALAENIETTRKFLLEDCTPENYLYVSEVYDDVVFKTQSREYIDLLRRSIDRFPELAKEHDLAGNLDLAIRSMLLD